MGSGAIITRPLELGNNVKVAANSVVNKSVTSSNILLAGSPAKINKQDIQTWIEMYSGEDGEWRRRQREVDNLKIRMNL